MGMSLEDRLWSRVDRSGGPDACWPWVGGGGHVFGYGQIWDADLGRAEGAHRVAYRLVNGAIPEDAPCIRHTCDNPPCCNPAHLVAGTQSENLGDMSARGRRGSYDRRGESNPFARLSASDVREIRARYAAGERPKAIGRSYGVTRSCVGRIVSRQTWAHVD